jgi:hypothetical protein
LKERGEGGERINRAKRSRGSKLTFGLDTENLDHGLFNFPELRSKEDYSLLTKALPLQLLSYRERQGERLTNLIVRLIVRERLKIGVGPRVRADSVTGVVDVPDVLSMIVDACIVVACRQEKEGREFQWAGKGQDISTEPLQDWPVKKKVPLPSPRVFMTSFSYYTQPTSREKIGVSIREWSKSEIIETNDVRPIIKSQSDSSRDGTVVDDFDRCLARLDGSRGSRDDGRGEGEGGEASQREHVDERD